MTKISIKVPRDILATLLICAFRYALGRRSYMVFRVSEIVVKYRRYILLNELNVLLKDLDAYRSYGVIDRPIWLKFKKIIEKEYTKKSGGK